VPEDAYSLGPVDGGTPPEVWVDVCILTTARGVYTLTAILTKMSFIISRSQCGPPPQLLANGCLYTPTIPRLTGCITSCCLLSRAVSFVVSGMDTCWGYVGNKKKFWVKFCGSTSESHSITQDSINLITYCDKICTLIIIRSELNQLLITESKF
jgi:hypothetical protein